MAMKVFITSVMIFLVTTIIARVLQREEVSDFTMGLIVFGWCVSLVTLSLSAMWVIWG